MGNAQPKLRKDIQTLLEGHGATDINELWDALGLEKQGFDRRTLGQTLRHMAEQNLLRRDGNMVMWIARSKNGVRPYQDDAQAPQHIRNRPVEAPPSIRQPRKIELPEFQKARQGHLVTLETAPDEYPDVVQVQALIGDQWFNVPMNGSMRICIGDRIPKWTPSQEHNFGIRALRFVHADGSFELREGLNPNEAVVFAFGS